MTRGRYFATLYKKIVPLNRPLLRINVAAAKQTPEPSFWRSSCTEGVPVSAMV
jgi:hypothetical protein